jgi:hypothetical protein
VRDAGLRWVATRRGLVVPSLLADRAVDEPTASIGPEAVDPAERHLIAAVEDHVEAHEDGHPVAEAAKHVETTA